MNSIKRHRRALALGLALIPVGIRAEQEAERPQPERRGPQVLEYYLGNRPSSEQMEQFRRQFDQMQRRLPDNARMFRFAPEGVKVDPDQLNSLFLFQGESDRPLGLTLREMPEVLRSHLDLPEGRGVVVSEVSEDGSAAGKIEPNDILLSLGNAPLGEPDDLAEAIENAKGNTLSFRLVRRGEEQTVEVDRTGSATEGGERYRLGVMIEVPDDAIRSQLGLREGQGVIVIEVTPGSAAQASGVEANDILLEINGESIAGAKELSDQVQETGGEAVELKLLRDGEEMTIEVSPEKVAESPVASDVPKPPAGFRFFGPGVMIDPQTGAIRPGPEQHRNFAFPEPPTADRERSLDEMRQQIDRLREEIDALKRSQGRRQDR